MLHNATLEAPTTNAKETVKDEAVDSHDVNVSVASRILFYVSAGVFSATSCPARCSTVQYAVRSGGPWPFEHD